MKQRLNLIFNRAKYAAIGAAVGAAVGGIVSKNAASTGGAIGGLVGAVVGETRVSAETVYEQFKDSLSDYELGSGSEAPETE
ncbi:YMGG-like glycine zipper-containing protein [Natranaeroarchaeum aerophilus]|uniref:YMGG-like glycine zipper-containing protein n=1 Tax=Natranaeroarchaeum aerophilus TaxID=2917711 RepID=A0AAE3FTE1_9EURY|nr:YMGG-like glycine zipper-containing protein [Natranaeroarchaeum aerophilus]MCL9814264.1 YMGG-like glycine zipper-containing protein [Natranaeroarchaeum aerophilus]